jgi:hypothetical protein
MLLIPYLLLLALPVLAFSIALALLPIRDPRGLASVMAIEAVTSVGLIWWLPGTRLWCVLLGPGLALAVIRLVRVLVTGRTKL